MIKVLLVANTDWYLYNYRLTLARYLRGQGFEIMLCSPQGRYAPAFAEQGFRWIPWKLGRKTLAPWGELGSLLQLLRIYRKEGPGLVHHHTTLCCRRYLCAWRGGQVVNSITSAVMFSWGRPAALLQSWCAFAGFCAGELRRYRIS
jgi:hypothetical protein